MKKKEDKTEQVLIRVSKREKKMIEINSKALGLSISAYIRMLIHSASQS